LTPAAKQKPAEDNKKVKEKWDREQAAKTQMEANQANQGTQVPTSVQVPASDTQTMAGSSIGGVTNLIKPNFSAMLHGSTAKPAEQYGPSHTDPSTGKVYREVLMAHRQYHVTKADQSS
jgi:hypothetical protein